MGGPSYVRFALTSVLLLGAFQAHAGEKETCLGASDQGQRARKSGNLVDAKAQLDICAREVCPPIVRQDCLTWADEVSKSLPTVSIGVRDKEGHDLVDVRVLVDGKTVTEHLDGKSFAVNPGMHVIRAEDGAHTPVEERVLVKEGEKARAINLRFSSLGSKPADAPVAPETPEGPSEPSGRSVLPFVVMGVGAIATGVGLGVHFAGKGAFPANCKSDTSKVDGRDGTCSPTADDPTGQKSGDAAMSSVNLRNAGTALTFGGAGLLVGGLIWFFIDSPAQKKTARPLPLMPSTGPGFAGLTWAGQF